MKVFYGYNYASIEREAGDPASIFKDMRMEYSFNTFLPKYCDEIGIQYAHFDEFNVDHLRAMLPKVVEPYFCNWLYTQLCLAKGEPAPKFNPYLKGKGTKSKSSTYILSIDNGQRCFFKGLRSNSKKLRVRTGWIPDILAFFEEEYKGMPIKFTDVREKTLTMREELILTRGKLTAFDYQREILEETFEEYRTVGMRFAKPGTRISPLTNSLYNLAVNSGKTFIAGLYANHFINAPTLLPFLNKLPFEQAVADYLELGFDVSVICADQTSLQKYLKLKGVQGTVSYNTFGDFCLVMVPTFMSGYDSGLYGVDDLEKYDLLLIDEVHSFTGKTAQKFVDMTKAMSKLSYSGTPLDKHSDERNAVIVGYSGWPRQIRSTADNIKDFVSLPMVVQVHLNRPEREALINGISRRKTDKKKVRKEKLINFSQTRINALLDAIEEHEDKQIIIYFGRQKLEVGEFILEKIKAAFPDITVDITTGKDKATSQKQDAFFKGDLQILITNIIFKQSINLKNIAVFINWDSTGLKEDIKQGPIGRSVRLFKGLDKVYIVEFYDDVGAYDMNSLKRLAVYASEEHNATIEFKFDHLKYPALVAANFSTP